MSTSIDLEDYDLSGFTEHAEHTIRENIDSYISDIIRESSRIEAGRNTPNNPTEITTRMVNEADFLIRGGISSSNYTWGDIFIKVTASIMPFALGIMYDSTKLQEGWYMALFIITVVVTVILVTASVVKN